MMGALGALGAMMETNEVSHDQLQKQLLRHQIPIAKQVEAIAEIIAYQRSLIPEHLVNPLIDSTIQYITNGLNSLKIDAAANKAKTMEALKQVEQQVDSGQLQQIEKAIKDNQ